MNTQQRDPIFESLDRLAGTADTDLVGDRMPDIQRRVRVARRRKGAGLVAAAAVLAVAGVGALQALPSEQAAPPVTTPDPTPWQEIAVDAHAQGAKTIQISFTVTGRSTAYSDSETGDPIDYAGPAYTEVLVDGKSVTGSDGGEMACDPRGDLKRYSTEFFSDEPFAVPVSPGEHTVVVKAPYCADGKVVESSQKVAVTTESADYQIFDKRSVDLDGDGTKEVVRVLALKDAFTTEQLLRVGWGTGETTEASLPNTMETNLRDPADLDGDGDLELVLLGGGGETAVGTVFQAAPDGLQRVRSVDASGEELPLSSDADPAAWQTYLGTDGIYSYRLTDPSGTQLPAPVEVRGWTLHGNTLTQSEETTSQCVTFQPRTSLGPC